MTTASVTAGITTAPRKVNYLEATLRSLSGQVPRIQIFAEPGAELPGIAGYPEITVHRRGTRLGNWHNWKDMAGYLLANTTTPYILTAEDDVLFSARAVSDALAAARECDLQWGFVSLYLNGRDERKFRPDEPGLKIWWIPRLWGACAWLFPRASLQAILAHPRAASWPGTRPERVRSTADVDGVDICVGQIALALQMRTGFLYPSRVQHIGECSSLGSAHDLAAGRRALSTVVDAGAAALTRREP